MSRSLLVLLFLLCSCVYAEGQELVHIIIKDAVARKPVSGATVVIKGMQRTFVTDSLGRLAIDALPSGTYTLEISSTGFASSELQLAVPATSDLIVMLSPEAGELEEIIVQSTRISRSIENTATRIETIEGEEIDEKANMRPANVSMLLHESTGLQVQQTSATTGNASVRVQGLDGKYTQLLKDGYPNFGNFASGLSILEIPPLDLSQVEIIKGPASTLYGGGAIAGVINFISKRPTEAGELNLLVNQSNVGQTNIGGFKSKKYKQWGFTMLALLNLQKEYDVDDDDFSELPESNNFTLHPKIFFYPGQRSSLMIGNSYTQGKSTGGDMRVIKGKADADHVYFEENETVRNTTTLEFKRSFDQKNVFEFKQSLSFFDRRISIPDYQFSGVNRNSFTEVSLAFVGKSHVLNTGLNFIYDNFRHRKFSSIQDQNARTVTAGLYAQDIWDVSKRVIIETGVRLDHASYSNDVFSNKQLFVLPRFSTLFKFTNELSSRLSAGLGYKVPTLFTEQTETIQYKDLRPLINVSAERSIGGTADINYRKRLSDLFHLSVNQMFFYTTIRKPLTLIEDFGALKFINASKPVKTTGFETNLRLIYRNYFKLFGGYTYTYARAMYLPGNNFLRLLPRNKVNLALVYEKEDNVKVGLEGYFTDKQFLSDGNSTAAYWEFGFMVEKAVKSLRFYINFENFTDQRQSRYKTVSNPPHNDPGFDEIWNHTEGFIINGGIKLKL